MEKLEIYLPVSGKGNKAVLPRGARVLSVVGGSTEDGRVELPNMGRGFAVVSLWGKRFYLERSCIYYMLISPEERMEKERQGSSLACRDCLLTQALRKLKAVYLRKGETVREAVLRAAKKIKYKCPYGYSMKPGVVTRFLLRTMSEAKRKRVQVKGNKGLVVYEGTHPVPVRIYQHIASGNTKKEKTVSSIPQKIKGYSQEKSENV